MAICYTIADNRASLLLILFAGIGGIAGSLMTALVLVAWVRRHIAQLEARFLEDSGVKP